MKILLTGSTGLLGNNLVRYLLDSGHQVRCAVRNRSAPALDGLDVEVSVAQFSAQEDWRPLLEGCQAVIHCAAIIHLGWRRMEEAHRVNVEVTRQIAQAARATQSRLIHVSSVDTLAHSPDQTPIDEDVTEPLCPPCNYVVTKTGAEQAIHQELEKGLDAVIVHPGFMLGNWDWKPSSGKLLIAIAKKQIPLAPAGGCCAVDVMDVVRGITSALSLGKSGEHYILGGHNLTYRELFAKFQKIVGGRAPRWVLPPAAARVGGFLGDSLTRILGRETDFNSAMLQMGQLFHFYQSTKAIAELDYAISPLEPAIEKNWEFVEWHHLKLKQNQD